MGRIFGSIAHCWSTRLRPPHLRSLMEALAVFTPKGQIASLVPRSGKDTTFGVPRISLPVPGIYRFKIRKGPWGNTFCLFLREETS